MKSKKTIVYLDSWNNPVDLESLTYTAGTLCFDSIGATVGFILANANFIMKDGEYVLIHPSYHSIQKQLKRYGYFKAYTHINNIFVSYMIRYYK